MEIAPKVTGYAPLKRPNPPARASERPTEWILAHNSPQGAAEADSFPWVNLTYKWRLYRAASRAAGSRTQLA